ncbi:hypothetical protein [Pseudonocardia sp. N23]|uniref:hypothetical protein n=1 Tax=Pseudonocardia sp. N23 TaxID=1987376 RepID=UPI000BFC2FC6|nr:hypothetical protein [Pseudonocardia sp. N23]
MPRVAARVPQRWPVLLALLVALLVPVGPVSARAHQVGDGAPRAAGSAVPARADSGTRRTGAAEASFLRSTAAATTTGWSAVPAVATRSAPVPRPSVMWGCGSEVATAEPVATWSPRCERGPPVSTV